MFYYKLKNWLNGITLVDILDVVWCIIVVIAFLFCLALIAMAGLVMYQVANYFI